LTFLSSLLAYIQGPQTRGGAAKGTEVLSRNIHFARPPKVAILLHKIVMLTKSQKVEKVEQGIKDVQGAKVILFGDFSKVKVSELATLRSELRKMGAKFQVIKKRLLRIVFEKSGIDFNPEQFEGQAGTVFSDKDISEAAGVVYKFSRTTLGEDKKPRFQILGGLDVAEKKFLDAAFVNAVGSLPSREVLLGQLLGTLLGPAKSLLYLLQEKSKVNN